MDNVFLLLFFTSIVALVIGLVRPNIFAWFLKDRATKKGVAIIFGTATVVFFVLFTAITKPRTQTLQATQESNNSKSTDAIEREVQQVGNEPTQESVTTNYSTHDIYTNDEDKMKKVIDEELSVEVLDVYYALGRLSNLKTFEYPFAAIKNPKGNGYIGYVLTSFNNKNYVALYFVPYEALNQYEKDLIYSIKAINGTAKDLTPSVEFGDRSEFDPIDVLQWLRQ